MSEVKVNKISPRSGTTVTLGDSGDTFTVPSGVTFDASSGGLAGTLTTAAQPNITSVGTLTSFTSTGIDDNATSTAITISSAGRIGIGTTAPDAELQIAPISSGTNASIVLANSNRSQYFRIQNNETNDALVFNANDLNERMRIDSSGNVGINNSSPTVPLEVDGFVKINEAPGVAGGNLIIDSTATGNSQLRFYQGGTAKGYLTYWDSSDTLALTDGSQNGLHFSPSTQRVGIGTSSPDSPLDILTSGNSGLEVNAGTSSAHRIYLGNTGGTSVVGTLSNHNFAVITNASERIRIDSSGNVGIGTSSPGSPLTVSGGTNTTVANINNNVSATTNVSNTLLLQTNSTGSAGVGFGLSIAFNGERNDGNTQRFGNVSWEATTNSGTSLATDFFISHYGGTETFRVKQNGRIVRNANALAEGHGNFIGEVGSSYKALSFSRTSGGSEVGNVVANTSSTSYNTSSDYRLKENVSYDFDATTRLKQLKPARFNFISDADTTVDGFLAHEVSSVVPEAISGTHNEVEVWKEGEELPEGVSVGDNKLDGEGNTIPVYQGIDQAKLVPLLVKTIQELEARITTLENA